MIKILIADDDPDILAVMAKKIVEAGFEAVAASDGEQAWNKICLENPDVIVLDLVMPGLHGFDVLARLRANPPADKWQPVIIVSGNDELTSMKKGFELEADHYLTKPCQMADVLKAIHLMIGLIPHRRPAGAQSAQRKDGG